MKVGYSPITAISEDNSLFAVHQLQHILHAVEVGIIKETPVEVSHRTVAVVSNEYVYDILLLLPSLQKEVSPTKCNTSRIMLFCYLKWNC